MGSASLLLIKGNQETPPIATLQPLSDSINIAIARCLQERR